MKGFCQQWQQLTRRRELLKRFRFASSAAWVGWSDGQAHPDAFGQEARILSVRAPGFNSPRALRTRSSLPRIEHWMPPDRGWIQRDSALGAGFRLGENLELEARSSADWHPIGWPRHIGDGKQG